MIEKSGAPFYDQLRKYYKKEQSSFTEILNFLDGTNNWSDDLKYISKKFRDTVDKEVKYEKKGVIFDNILLRITVEEIHPLVKGSKITNLYGKI